MIWSIRDVNPSETCRAWHLALPRTCSHLESGLCLVGRHPYGLEIQRRILEHYWLISGEYLTLRSFAKSAHFSRSYADRLSRELSVLQPLRSQHRAVVEQPTRDHSSFPNDRPLFLFCRTTQHDRLLVTIPRPFQEFFLFTHCKSSRKGPSLCLCEKSPRLSYPIPRPSTLEPRGIPTSSARSPKMHKTKFRRLGWLQNSTAWVAVPHLSTSGVLLYPFLSGKTA